jgi:L-fuculose-phosphate aldolase
MKKECGMEQEYRELREKLCETARLLYERGLVSGTDGNISVRASEDAMLITPSGVSKRELEPASLIVQKLDGTIVSGRGKSSREAKLHAAIYRIRTEIGAVVHTHPAAATAFAMCGQTLPDNCLVEVPAVIGKIALAGYAPAGSGKLAENVRMAAVDSDVIFMQNHGVVTCGKDLTAAFNKMEMVENAARTICYAKLLGGIREF